MDKSIKQRRLRSLPRPAVDDEPEPFTWMTYDEIAQAFAIGRDSARRLAMRRGWRRTLGNDGMARIAVADAELAQRKRRTKPSGRPDAKADAVRAELVRRVEQLTAACERAENDVRAARSDAENERGRNAALSAELRAARSEADAAAAHVAGLALRLAMETSRREDLQDRFEASEAMIGDLEALRGEANAAAASVLSLSARLATESARLAMEKARGESLQAQVDRLNRNRVAMSF